MLLLQIVRTSMFPSFKNIFFAVSLLLVGLIGLKTYRYFFDKTVPEISILGIEKDGYYAGDMQCAVLSNKNGDISLWLDGQPLVARFRLSGKSEHSFVIPTKTIAHGPHVLKASFVENSYRKSTAQVEQSFIVDNIPIFECANELINIVKRRILECFGLIIFARLQH